jgi:hypothetical protein
MNVRPSRVTSKCIRRRPPSASGPRARAGDAVRRETGGIATGGTGVEYHGGALASGAVRLGP